VFRLDAADLARRSVAPSNLSLLGLVRHMAKVERTWFRLRMAGQDLPRHYRSDADHDADFNGWSSRQLLRHRGGD
jgi:hypothetical protein